MRERIPATVPVALGPGMVLKGLLASGSGGAATLPGRCRLAVQQGELRILGADGSSLVIEGAQCDLEAKPGDNIQGTLSWAAATLAPADGQPMRLDSLYVDGKTSLALSVVQGLK